MTDVENQTNSPAAVRLTELREVLEGSVTFGRRFREDLNFAPADGSPFEVEAVELNDRQASLDAMQSGNLSLTAGEDHLVGLSRLLIEPTLQFAPDVLGRAALEAFARCWFQLDLKIDAMRRRGRYLNDRVVTLKHSRKVAVTEAERDRFHDRLQKLWDDAENDHVIVRDKKGKPLGVDEVRPGSTEVIGRFFEGMSLGKQIGTLVYQHYSSISHASASGLLEAYDFEPDPSEAGTYRGVPGGSFESIEWGAALPLLGWIFAFDRLVWFCGWDPSDWISWRQHTYRVVITQMRTRPQPEN